MLIGLISDTHENMPLLKKAVEYFNSCGVSLVLHAGDIISPICARELKNLKAKMIGVFGNNDGEKNLWKERIKNWGEIHENFYETVIENQKLLLIHEPFLMDALAASQKYDVIVYGHTHQVDERSAGKTLIVNPGECGGWLNGKCTIATLELPQKTFKVVDITE